MGYSHTDVAHAWMHQHKDEMRGHALYYIGRTILSYGEHCPIASHAKHKDKECILFTSQPNPSVSTAKHMGIVKAALYGPVFYVDKPFYTEIHSPSRLYGNVIVYTKGKGKIDHKHNLKMIKSNIESLYENLAKRKPGSKAFNCVFNSLHSTIENGNGYASFFGLKTRFEPVKTELLVEYQEKAKLFKVQEEKRKATLDKKQREKIDDWLRCKSNSIPDTRITYCRVNGDRLETSKGVKVPLADALRMNRMAEICRKDKTTFNRGDLPEDRFNCNIGQFKLDRIESNGDIVAGCHLLTWEVQELAKDIAGIK